MANERITVKKSAGPLAELSINMSGANTVTSASIVQYIPLALTLSAVIYIFYQLLWSVGHRSGTPNGLNQLPGPRANIFGHHAGQFDPVAPFQMFQKWANRYGKIFMVKIGSQPIVSVNDPVLAKELFEKRGANYSSRLAPYVGYELLSQKRRIGFTPSGDKHRAFRKQVQSVLSITKAQGNRRYQELESRQLLQEILDWSESDRGRGKREPNGCETDSGRYDQVLEIFRRYTASVMTTLAFGHRVKALNDDFVKTIFAIMNDFAASCQPGRYYVDIFPILRKLPPALRYWEHEVRAKLKWRWAFLGELLSRVEQQKAHGIANAGLIRALVDERQYLSEADRDSSFLDDRSIGYQAMTLMEAGSDTTANTLMNFVLAMILHPDVMRKGQECVDSCSTSSKLPGFSEISRMRYVLQVTKETLRWRPVVIMGVPHASIKDDVVDGFHVPGGSVVYGNIWYMHNNPTLYKDPTSFIPERYMGNTKLAFESSNEPNALARDHYTFG